VDPQRDLVAVTERLLAAHALAVDVRAVEAPEIAENEDPVALSRMQCSFETILSRS